MKLISVLFLIGATKGAFVAPTITASELHYDYQQEMILYKMSGDLDSQSNSDMTYKGFQFQVWAYCHDSATTVLTTTFGINELCEADRKGYNFPTTNNCAENCEKANAVAGVALAMGNNTCEPNCWTLGCSYDSTDCQGTAVAAPAAAYESATWDPTGNTYDVGGGNYATAYTATKLLSEGWNDNFQGSQRYGQLNSDMCYWNRLFQKQSVTSTTDCHIAHTKVRDLERISGRITTTFNKQDANAALDYYLPEIEIEPFYTPHPLDSNMFMTPNGELWGYKKNFYKSSPLFQDCEDGDEINAFTISRHTDGSFSYSSTVSKIGTYHKRPNQFTLPTKFFFSKDESTGYAWFYMRTASLYSSTTGLPKGFAATASKTQMFTCLEPHLLKQTSSRVDSGGVETNENWRCTLPHHNLWHLAATNDFDASSLENSRTATNPGCHQEFDHGAFNTVAFANPIVTAQGTADCTCGGIQDFFKAGKDVVSATCAYGDGTNVYPDGFVKCTITGKTIWSDTAGNKVCDSGEALVNVEALGRMDENGNLEGLSLEDAVIGYYTEGQMELKNTWKQRTVNEEATSFENPVFTNYHVNMEDVTLLLACGNVDTEPTNFWEQRTDNATLPTDLKHSHSVFNPNHNKLKSFDTNCEFGNVLLGSIDGHNWEGIATIVKGDDAGNTVQSGINHITLMLPFVLSLNFMF